VSSAPRPARGGPAADVLTVLGTFLVVGAVAGLLWWVVSEPAKYTKGPAGLSMGEQELSRQFATDGWYAVIAVLAGFVSGVAVTWWRSRDFRITTVLLMPASVVAATTMAAVGRLLGPDTPGADLVRRGGSVPAELAVSAVQVYLMWPIAMLAGALMVLWSSPEALPPSRSSGPSGPESATEAT
jgi:hypothetical protein